MAEKLPVTYIYLVESPLQVINAHAAKHECEPSEEARHEVIIFEPDCRENNRIVRNTLKHLGWEPFRVVPFKKGGLQKLMQWRLICNEISKIQNLARIYVGGYAEKMAMACANKFRHLPLYLLDDGTNSLLFTEIRYQPDANSNLKSLLLRLFGYSTKLPKKLTFFSIYPITLRPPDNLILNKLKFLRDTVQLDAKGPVWFVGTCAFDDTVILKKNFLPLFSWVINQLNGQEIIYFPHRREDVGTKANFLKKHNIKVATINLPFELELSSNLQRPSKIASFFSTVFDTLQLILPKEDQSLISYEIPEEVIMEPAQRNIAKRSYVKYEENGIVQVVRGLPTGNIMISLCHECRK